MYVRVCMYVCVCVRIYTRLANSVIGVGHWQRGYFTPDCTRPRRANQLALSSESARSQPPFLSFPNRFPPEGKAASFRLLFRYPLYLTASLGRWLLPLVLAEVRQNRFIASYYGQDMSEKETRPGSMLGPPTLLFPPRVFPGAWPDQTTQDTRSIRLGIFLWSIRLWQGVPCT